MSHKVFGIDFGTQMIKIYKKAQGIILHQKSIVAVNTNENMAIAAGDEAYHMYEKSPSTIRVTFPLAHGAVASMEDMTGLWNYIFGKIAMEQKIKGAEFYIAVPCDITEVEKRAFYDVLVASRLHIKKAVLVDKPIADALGAGIDINRSTGVMMVNMGADTTEISILSLGGIVVSKLLPIGGNSIDEAIRSHLSNIEHFSVGSKTAEMIKQYFAGKGKNAPDYEVRGSAIVKGLPHRKNVTASMIWPYIEEYINEVAEAVRTLLERTPPEISSEIIEQGVYISGGTSSIIGVEQLLSEKTGYLMNVCKNAQTTVIEGIGSLIEQPKYAEYYLSKHSHMTLTK